MISIIRYEAKHSFQMERIEIYEYNSENNSSKNLKVRKKDFADGEAYTLEPDTPKRWQTKMRNVIIIRDMRQEKSQNHKVRRFEDTKKGSIRNDRHWSLQGQNLLVQVTSFGQHWTHKGSCLLQRLFESKNPWSERSLSHCHKCTYYSISFSKASIVSFSVLYLCARSNKRHATDLYTDCLMFGT